MNIQTKQITKKLLCSALACAVCISSLATSGVYAQSTDGETRLGASDCRIPVTVEQAYDIDFGTFNANDVFDGPMLAVGTIDGSNATSHTSNVPSVSTAQYYLVVQDRCGLSKQWHADILASDMDDINVSNSVTADSIPANNLELITDGKVYFLDQTPENSEVTATTYADPTSFGTAIQLLERNSTGNTVGGLFGVYPGYGLTIPQHQQADSYKGTITWTVI